MPAGLLDEAEHHGQAKTGAAAFGLGGEKWLKNPRDDVGRHAMPGVGHSHHDVVARRHLDMAARVVGIQHLVGQFDGQASATRHRIARVQRQVQHRAFQLRRIGHRGP